MKDSNNCHVARIVLIGILTFAGMSLDGGCCGGVEPPVIVPGTSLNEPDQAPAAINPDLPGGYAQVIAHWDVVPDQKFTDFLFYNVARFDCGPIQGIYDDDNGAGETRDEVAFVNVLIDRNEHSNANGHWSGLIHTNHFLLWHVTHDHIGFRLNSPNITNLSVKGCSWDWLAGDAMSLYAPAFDQNHFKSGQAFGMIPPLRGPLPSAGVSRESIRA